MGIDVRIASRFRGARVDVSNRNADPRFEVFVVKLAKTLAGMTPVGQCVHTYPALRRPIGDRGEERSVAIGDSDRRPTASCVMARHAWFTSRECAIDSLQLELWLSFDSSCSELRGRARGARSMQDWCSVRHLEDRGLT